MIYLFLLGFLGVEVDTNVLIGCHAKMDSVWVGVIGEVSDASSGLRAGRLRRE